VVSARKALLERCLADLLAAPPPAATGGPPPRAAPAFLAFLQPQRAGAPAIAKATSWKSPLGEFLMIFTLT